MLICFNSTIFYFIGNLHYNHLYFLLFKGAIYLISVLQQVCICFHSNSKKEVNLIYVFTVYRTWWPLSSIGSMQICHRPHHYWENLFKNHKKLVLVIYLVTPPTFKVYKCYYIKLNVLILLESY